MYGHGWLRLEYKALPWQRRSTYSMDTAMLKRTKEKRVQPISQPSSFKKKAEEEEKVVL